MRNETRRYSDEIYSFDNRQTEQNGSGLHPATDERFSYFCDVRFAEFFFCFLVSCACFYFCYFYVFLFEWRTNFLQFEILCIYASSLLSVRFFQTIACSKKVPMF